MSLTDTSFSVDLWELDDSPQETWSREGAMTARRKFHCAWSDRVTAQLEFLGTAGIRPHRYPGNARAFAREVQVKRAANRQTNTPSDPNTLAAYELAELTVIYAEPDTSDNEDEDPETLIRERYEGAAEFISMPADDLVWGDNGADLETDGVSEAAVPGKILHSIDWVVEIPQVETVPSNIFALAGHTNDEVLQSLNSGLSFGRETLLYQAPAIRRETFTDGSERKTLTLRFGVRESGWNYFWRRDGGNGSGGFEPIFRKGGSQMKPFPPASWASVAPELVT